MGIEPFVDHWWSKKGGPLPRKMIESIRSSENLFDELESLFTERFGQVGISSEGAIPLYDALVTRHLGSSSVALTIIEGGGAAQEYTFDQIDRLVNGFIEECALVGIKPGSRVALFLPKDIHYTIALLTTVRLGAHVAFFPQKTPYSSLTTQKESLALFNPDFVIGKTKDPTFDEAFHWVVIKELTEKERGALQNEYTFAHLFESPLYTSSRTVIVKQFYKRALCDGLIALGLRKGMRWAAPLRNPMKEEPYCSLLALLFGVVTVELEPVHIEKSQLDILSISTAFLEDLLENDLLTRPPKVILRNPSEGRTDLWRTFLESPDLEKNTLIDWVCESGFGGALLFSRPKFTRDAKELFDVESPFQFSWDITHENGSGEKSETGTGIFSIEDEGELVLTNYLLAPIGTRWMIYTTKEPLHRGAICPAKKIEAIAQFEPFVQSASLLLLARPNDSIDKRLVLLLFINPAKKVEGDLCNRIESAVAEQVGDFFRPEKIEVFHQFPRQKKGVDHRWVEGQYLSKQLSLKEKNPLYQEINLLRSCLYD